MRFGIEIRDLGDVKVLDQSHPRGAEEIAGDDEEQGQLGTHSRTSLLERFNELIYTHSPKGQATQSPNIGRLTDSV